MKDALTMRVKQDLGLQQSTGQGFHHIVHTQQREGFSQRILPEGELSRPGPLAQDGSLHPVELQRPARRWQRHLIQNIVDVALQGEGRRCV